MSNIKQERHFSSTSNFPTIGAENVEYTSRSDVYGKDWYWDSSTNTYKRKIGNILEFPYSNADYPSLTTIQLVLDYLLASELGITFDVTPSTVRITGVTEVRFEWTASKDASDIESVYIVSSTYSSGNLQSVMGGTHGVYSADVSVNGLTTFTITVTDTDGNVATSTDTINIVSGVVEATLTVLPATFTPGSGLTDVTLSWTVNQSKENIATNKLYITNSLTESVINVYDLSLNTVDGLSGNTTLPSQTIPSDITYTLYAETTAGYFGQANDSIDYLDGQIVFTVTNGGSPVSGATITVAGVTGTWNTNTSGVATISSIGYGSYVATVSKSGYVTQNDIAFTIPDDTTKAVALELETNTVTFTVWDDITPTPNALSDIRINITGNGFVTTGSGGTATKALANGDYTYTVSEEGFTDIADGTFTVNGDTSVSVNLTTEGLVELLTVTNALPGETATISYTWKPEPAATYEGYSRIFIYYNDVLEETFIKGASYTGNSKNYIIPAEWTSAEMRVEVQGRTHAGVVANTVTWTKDMGTNAIYAGYITGPFAETIGFDSTPDIASPTLYNVDGSGGKTAITDVITEAKILSSLEIQESDYVTISQPQLMFQDLFDAGGAGYPFVAFPTTDPVSPEFNQRTAAGDSSWVSLSTDFYTIDVTVNSIAYKLYVYFGTGDGTTMGIDNVFNNYEFREV